MSLEGDTSEAVSGGAGKGHITNQIGEILTEVGRRAEYQRPPD